MNDKPKFTDQQAAAIQTRHVSVALSAGAGCGKTFVLTQRFLAQLQPEAGSDSLHSIVAITFTDRAAREMRDRIREACRAELRRCDDADVAHWLEVLRGLDAARISTIHAFCANLLRSHAVDAGIDPRFGLLEQSTSGAFLRKEVEEAVHDLLVEQNPDCMEFVLHYGLERTQDLLRTFVLQRFSVDVTQFLDLTPGQLAANWRTRWRDECIPNLLRELVEGDAAAQVLRLLEAHESSHDEMRRRCDFIRTHLPGLHEEKNWQTLLAELQQCCGVKGGGTKKHWESEDVHAQVRDGLSALREELKRIAGLVESSDDDVELATEMALRAARLTRIVADRYDAAKREFGLLDFDDLLLRTCELLRNSESVRRRAAAGIRFLMVDEFQDTDPIQAEIVRMLCGDQLLAGKLFLVGDAKQSIYRFRRADPGVFHALRNEIPEPGRLPLSVNFRSQPQILNFVNCLFAPSMGAAYEKLESFDRKQLSPTPAIEFLFSSLDPEEETDNADKRREQEADWIARRIAGLLGDQTPRIRERNSVTGEYGLRPPRMGDVAVLFRTLSNVSVYEDALRRYGVDYYLVGGRAFYAQQEIFDLINLCQFLDDCDDEVSLAGVLRSPFFSLDDDSLYALASEARSLYAGLSQPPPEYLSPEQHRQITHAARVLNELRQKKDRVALAELLNLALERTGYDAALVNEFLGRRKLANLQKLIDMARQFDQTGLFTLKDFVVRMRESIDERTDEELAATHPETSDVVRLMTIHQSKGLEFPIVVIADMDWRPNQRGAAARFHPELGPLLSLPRFRGQKRENLGQKMFTLAEKPEEAAETERLLYVATTRASDYLILSACLPVTRKPSSPWLKLLAQRFDLETGQPAVDPYLGRLSLGDVSREEIPDIRVHHQQPAVPDGGPGRKAGLLPLAEFQEAVEAAEPEPWPVTLRRFPPDLKARRRFGVTEIGQADAELRGKEEKVLDIEPILPSRSSLDYSDGGSATMYGLSEAELVGTLVHEVLEQVDFRRPEQLEPLLESGIRGLERSIDAAVRKTAWRCLESLRDSSLWTEIAGAKTCYRELEFLLRRPMVSASGEDVVIAGIIDCLFQTDDGRWVVIDYKTGRFPKNRSNASVLVDYEIQVGLYVQAVNALIGRTPDAVELALLQSGVRRVPFEVTLQRMDEINSRVERVIVQLREAPELATVLA